MKQAGADKNAKPSEFLKNAVFGDPLGEYESMVCRTSYPFSGQRAELLRGVSELLKEGFIPWMESGLRSTPFDPTFNYVFPMDQAVSLHLQTLLKEKASFGRPRSEFFINESFYSSKVESRYAEPLIQAKGYRALHNAASVFHEKTHGALDLYKTMGLDDQGMTEYVRISEPLDENSSSPVLDSMDYSEASFNLIHALAASGAAGTNVSPQFEGLDAELFKIHLDMSSLEERPVGEQKKKFQMLSFYGSLAMLARLGYAPNLTEYASAKRDKLSKVDKVNPFSSLAQRSLPAPVMSECVIASLVSDTYNKTMGLVTTDYSEGFNRFVLESAGRYIERQVSLQDSISDHFASNFLGGCNHRPC